jgi:hypothetical protein
MYVCKYVKKTVIWCGFYMGIWVWVLDTYLQRPHQREVALIRQGRDDEPVGVWVYGCMGVWVVGGLEGYRVIGL